MSTEAYRTPGQMVKALMSERGWTQRVLAIILRMDETAVGHVTADRRPINAQLAIALGEVFATPAEDFLAVQKAYDLAKARIATAPDPGRATRAHLFGGLPITEMLKRGWLKAESIHDVAAVEAELVKFFGVGSPDEIEILPHASKKTTIFAPATPAQLAWLYRVREIAGEMLVPAYSPAALRRGITKLRALRSAPENTRRVPRILAECGVRYVIVETLTKAKVDGVCFWLTDASPVVGMSLRYDRIDNFWFVLRHELEHVLKRHGRSAVMLDAELEGEQAGTGETVAEEEREANETASEFCVPRKTLEAFIARKAPFFNERDILSLAKLLHVHPGLVAGQLQHQTGRYDRFRQHLAAIRFAVLPNAMHDGWGDVAPVGI